MRVFTGHFLCPTLVRDGGGHLGELPDHWAPRHARGSPVAPGAGSQARRGVIWDGWQIEGLPRGGGTAAASGVGGQEEEGSSGLGLDGPQARRRMSRGPQDTALRSAGRWGPVPFWADTCGVQTLHPAGLLSENELTPHSHPAWRLVAHSEKRGRGCRQVQSRGARQHSDRGPHFEPQTPQELAAHTWDCPFPSHSAALFQAWHQRPGARVQRCRNYGQEGRSGAGPSAPRREGEGLSWGKGLGWRSALQGPGVRRVQLRPQRPRSSPRLT